MDLLDEEKADSRHDNVAAVQAVQAVDPRQSTLYTEVHALLVVEFACVAVDAEEVLVGCEDGQVALYKLVDDLLGGVLPASDFFVEVKVNVCLIRQRLMQVVLVSLNRASITFDSFC